MISVCCKLLEHVIYRHVIQHCEDHNILADFQHGFRSKHSCETQLIVTTEDIAKALDKGKQVDLLILDYSKAFGTVAHQRLLYKLDFYGINGHINTWLRHWLTNRTQTVVVEGDSSDDVPVKSGVPQGTVLGPLMFLLYINDIGENISTESKLRLFADDSLLYTVKLKTGRTLDIDRLKLTMTE